MIFYILIAIPAFILLLVLIGLTLNKYHVASGSKIINADKAKIWKLLTDDMKSPEWRKELKQVNSLPDRDGKICIEEVMKNGQKLSFQLLETVPEEKLVREIIDNKSFGGKWTILLCSEKGKTKVEITEEGVVYNPIFRLIMKLFMNPTATLEKYLSNLEEGAKN